MQMSTILKWKKKIVKKIALVYEVGLPVWPSLHQICIGEDKKVLLSQQWVLEIPIAFLHQ